MAEDNDKMSKESIYTEIELQRRNRQIKVVVIFGVIGLVLSDIGLILFVAHVIAYKFPTHICSKLLINSYEFMIHCNVFSEIQKYSTYICGYLFAIFVGRFSIALIIDTAWKCTKSLEGSDVWQPRIVGFLETVLYLVSFTAGGATYYIIPAWLVFKVAGAWRKGDSVKRLINNIFLIGTLLCLIYAAFGAFFGRYLHSKPIDLRIFVFGFMLFGSSLFTLGVWVYLKQLSERAVLNNWNKLIQSMGKMRTMRTRHVRDILGEPDYVERQDDARLIIWHYYLIDGGNVQVVFDGNDESGYHLIDIKPR